MPALEACRTCRCITSNCVAGPVTTMEQNLITLCVNATHAGSMGAGHSTGQWTVGQLLKHGGRTDAPAQMQAAMCPTTSPLVLPIVASSPSLCPHCMEGSFTKLQAGDICLTVMVSGPNCVYPPRTSRKVLGEVTIVLEKRAMRTGHAKMSASRLPRFADRCHVRQLALFGSALLGDLRSQSTATSTSWLS